MEGIDPLADKIRIFGGELGSVEAGNNTDESEINLDVIFQ